MIFLSRGLTFGLGLILLTSITDTGLSEITHRLEKCGSSQSHFSKGKSSIYREVQVAELQGNHPKHEILVDELHGTRVQCPELHDHTILQGQGDITGVFQALSHLQIEPSSHTATRILPSLQVHVQVQVQVHYITWRVMFA